MSAERDIPPPRGAFGESEEQPRRVPIRSEPAPRGTYDRGSDPWLSDAAEALALTVPPGERPSQSGIPGSIEEALQQLVEQVPTSARPPEPGPPPGSMPPPRRTVRPR